MKLHLIDTNSDVVSALRAAFARFAEVEVQEGNLLAVAKECLVSPANSYGFMDGGFDQALYSFFGLELEARIQEAINARPERQLPVGASLAVKTGHARIPFIIVAPTVTLPEHAEASNAYRAMRAILRIAYRERASFAHLFCPGLTTGVGNIPPAEAAARMAEAYEDFIRDTAA